MPDEPSASPTALPVPRSGANEPAWSKPAKFAETAGERAIVEFWDQYAEYLADCRPMYPVGIEGGLSGTGASAGFGASDPNLFIGLHVDGPILNLTVVLPGDAAIRYGTQLDDGPDLRFADGSEL